MKEGRGAPGVPLTAVTGHWQCGEALVQDTHAHTSWLRSPSGYSLNQPNAGFKAVGACKTPKTNSAVQNHKRTSSTPSSQPNISKHSSSSPAADVSEPLSHTPSPYFFSPSGSVPIKHVETIVGVLALRLKGGEAESGRRRSRRRSGKRRERN